MSFDRLSLSGNTQELLSRGVRVGLERREPYDPILEASIGYAGAAAVAVMDEVAFVNERQDERMEGMEEGALSLVPRVSSVEEENRQLREVQRAQEERIARDGERICQEIGLVALMFFFELFIFLCSSQFPSMFPLLTYSQSFLFLIC